MLKAAVTPLLALTLTLGGCASTPPPALSELPRQYCPPVGKWVVKGQSESLTTATLLESIQGARVILLGERHDRVDDHRWQLHLLAALHGRHEGMAVGFEMFSRPQQTVLDNWAAGELEESAFLRKVNWSETWGFPAELYLPLLHFVRLNQVPSVALNIERELLQRISREGWEAVPLSERYQIQAAAPGPGAYNDLLDDIMMSHHHGSGTVPEERRQAFRRAQGTWDRAMAEAIATALETHRGPVVGLVGRGHMQYGYGIPYQLRDMGVDSVVTLLPFSAGESCLDEDVAPADGLYGLPGEAEDTNSST